MSVVNHNYHESGCARDLTQNASMMQISTKTDAVRKFNCNEDNTHIYVYNPASEGTTFNTAAQAVPVIYILIKAFQVGQHSCSFSCRCIVNHAVRIPGCTWSSAVATALQLCRIWVCCVVLQAKSGWSLLAKRRTGCAISTMSRVLCGRFWLFSA